MTIPLLVIKIPKIGLSLKRGLFIKKRAMITIAIPEIQELIRKKRYRDLKESISEFLPADVVEISRSLDTPERLLIFRLLPKDLAALVFAELGPEEKKELLDIFTEEQIRKILEEMDPDDRTELFDELPAIIVKNLLKLLSPQDRGIAYDLMKYPEHSAGRIMTPEFVDIKTQVTAEEAIQHIRRTGPDKETIYYAYIIDANRKLLSIASLKDLLIANPQTKVEDIMQREVISVQTLDDQEEVARVIQRYDLLAVPVVDSEHRLVGIITVDDVIDVIEEEGTEDFHRMAAMEAPADSYLNTGFFTMLLKRFPWLLALLVTSTFTSNILEHYASVLQMAVALVFFIPMLCGTGGNTGTQASTIVIRGLAVGDISIKDTVKILIRESLTGITLGATLGMFGFIRAMLVQNSDPFLWVTVGIALAATVVAGNVAGALLPLFAQIVKIDPAVMAGPFITTIVDLTSLFIYFELAKRILIPH